MTPESRARCVVVGNDGLPASRAALARAAEQAGEESKVYVVHASTLLTDWVVGPHYQELLDVQLDSARDLMGRLEEESGGGLDGVDWETEVIGDAPARAIAHIAATRDADEIIVGTRGSGRARAPLGSVAREVIHLAECPVTVIPERVVARADAQATAGTVS